MCAMKVISDVHVVLCYRRQKRCGDSGRSRVKSWPINQLFCVPVVLGVMARWYHLSSVDCGSSGSVFSFHTRRSRHDMISCRFVVLLVVLYQGGVIFPATFLSFIVYVVLLVVFQPGIV